MDITELKEILRLTTKYVHSPAKAKWKATSHASQFVEAVSALPATATDEDIAEYIYGSRETGSKYYFLKSYVISTLLDHLLDKRIRHRINSRLTKLVLSGVHEYAITMVVKRVGAKNLAKRIARKALLVCEKAQMTALCVDLIETLRLYSVLDGDRTSYARLTRQLQQELSLLHDTVAIRSIDYELSIAFSRQLLSGLPHRLNLVKIISSSEQIAARHRKNFSIRMYAYRIQYACYQLQGQIEKSIRSCIAARKFIASKPEYYSKDRMGEFALYEFENYLLLRDYDSGQKCYRKCELFITEGTSVWFKLREYQFLFTMQTEQFLLADRIVREVTRHPSYGSQLTHLKERWSIYGLYAEYVNAVCDPDHSTMPSLVKKKEYKEIIIRFPTYSKDKGGFNVSILLLNILVLLEEHQFEAIVEQMESLVTYGQRYLRSGTKNEMAILFKLLKIMTREDFNFESILRKTKQLSGTISKSSRNMQEVSEGLQILPADWIWKRIIAILKQYSPYGINGSNYNLKRR